MTEEEKLNKSPRCVSFIVLRLIAIVILSLVGLIFPVDILPYPNEILLGILAIAAVALVITVCLHLTRWWHLLSIKLMEWQVPLFIQPLVYLV